MINNPKLIKEMKDYFNECIAKDTVYEEDLTINYMKIAKEYIEQLESDTIPKQVIQDLKEEYLSKIIKKQEEYDKDEEARHVAEDDLLCELLQKIGFQEVVKQYIKTSKWYA